MIVLENISKSFNKGSVNEVSALQNVSVVFAEGTFNVLIGANGSGKSTLLNIIAGDILPDSGKVIINGRDVTDVPDYKRAPYISRVFQDPMAGTASQLSILDNFRLASLRNRKKSLVVGTTSAFRERVAEDLKQLGLGLENRLAEPVGSLSGGQRQALTLLMAVAAGSGVLLMDEPTAALDPKTAGMIVELTLKLVEKHNLTTILVTHDLKAAARLGSRLILMKEGRLERDEQGLLAGKTDPGELYRWFV